MSNVLNLICFVVVVNGQQNQMILKFINSGTGNYTIVNAAASYHDVGKNWALVSHAMRVLKAQTKQYRILTCNYSVYNYSVYRSGTLLR
jgi:hypothetical protein